MSFFLYSFVNDVKILLVELFTVLLNIILDLIFFKLPDPNKLFNKFFVMLFLNRLVTKTAIPLY